MTERKNEVATQAQLSLSSLPTLPANPTRKIRKGRHDIAIFHLTNLNETYGVATSIDEKFSIFRFTEPIHRGHQCPPPKFVFLQTDQKPPWEPHEWNYETMSLEDKT
ncbi:hypothetical protein Tco_0510233, partial [Tanacetum coccineum]